MENSILFNSIFILLCFSAALFFCILDMLKKSSGYKFTIISGVIFTASFIYLLLNGGTMQEALIITLVFFLLNVQVFCKGEDNTKNDL